VFLQSLFVIVINGSSSTFFQARRGLRQGCPLLPCLFILVVDRLCREINFARCANNVHGVKLGHRESLTHLLFVEDVIIFHYCREKEAQHFKNILDLFCDVAGMVINLNKSIVYFPKVKDDIRLCISGIFNFSSHDMLAGFEYLGFSLKPNYYKIVGLEMNNFTRTKENQFMVQPMDVTCCSIDFD
jgi:hypothetical protein